MRQIRTSIVGLAACLFALATSNYVSAQPVTDGVIKVVDMGGDARYFVPGDSKPHNVKKGMLLKQGTIIQTAAGIGNYVDLILNNSHASAAPEGTPSQIASYTPKAEQDGIRIYENTVLSIDKLTVTQTGADTVTDTELDLKDGKILGTVKKLTPTSKYEVKVPNGVAGIRGTIYLATKTTVACVSGSVLVSYVGPDNNVATTQVPAGYILDLATGQLTQLSGQALETLIQDIFRFRNSGDSPPSPKYNTDHRIYYITPEQGGNGQGQNGNGQGGNPQ